MDNIPKPALTALRPTRLGYFRIKVLLLIFKIPFYIVFKRLFYKVEVKGVHHLDGGSKLLLINHHTQADPMILSYFTNRPIFFFMTEPAMANGLFAKLMAWLGQIPKKKLIADTACMRAMKGWAEIGGTVATFPEGQFSYDGYLGEIKPGLSQLVHFLDIPVVTARLINADRSWPAWAIVPRRTGLRIEIDPPRKFERTDNIEEIVEKRLYVDPNNCKRFNTKGKNLAKGLAKLLRFCLSCGSEHTLQEDKNIITCNHCTEQWVVDPTNTLSGKEKFTMKEALEKVKEKLEQHWQSGLEFKTISDALVMDASRPQWIEIKRGILILSENTLSSGKWSIEIKDIVAHTRDWGNILLIRTPRQRLAIKISHDEGFVTWSMALDMAINNYGDTNG